MWPEIDATIDPVMAAADFYILEAIAMGALYGYVTPQFTELTEEEENTMLDMLGVVEHKRRLLFRKDRKNQIKAMLKDNPAPTLKKIENAAAAMQKELVDILDKSFVHYVHIAVAGEVRHHKAIKGRVLSEDRNVAWAGWRAVFEAVGNRALLDLEELFLEFEDSGYGGPKWAEPCRVLYNRLEGTLGPNPDANKKLFVDRVFSIQHNGGALLDKISWKIKNNSSWTVGRLPELLDSHHADVPDIEGLSRNASPKIQKILMDYVKSAVGAKGVVLMHESFGLPLLREMNKEAYFVCKSCGSLAEKGHFGSCGFVAGTDSMIKAGIGSMIKKGKFVPDPEYVRQCWTDQDQGQGLDAQIFPFGPNGKGALAPDMSIVVKIDTRIKYSDGGYNSAFYDLKTSIQTTMGEMLNGPLNLGVASFPYKSGHSLAGYVNFSVCAGVAVLFADSVYSSSTMSVIGGELLLNINLPYINKSLDKKGSSC